MPRLYWVQSYHLLPNKAMEYQNWLKSTQAKELNSRYERETGIKYVNTYWTVLGFGDFDCETWWELPDWAALDKIRSAMTLMEEYMKATWKFMDTAREGSNRMLRTTEDVMTPKSLES